VYNFFMKTAKSRNIYLTDETRSKILGVARTLFTERGLFDTQMVDVASALGISRTTLYRYFQDKLDLALAIVTILLDEIHDAWVDPGPAPGRTARDRVGLYLKRVWANEGPYAPHLRYFAEFDAFFSGARIPEGFREKMVEAFSQDGDEAFLALIQEGQKDGSIRPDLDAHLTMSTLMNTIRGLQQRIELRGEVLVELRPEESKKLLDEALSYLLRGLAPGDLTDA